MESNCIGALVGSKRGRPAAEEEKESGLELVPAKQPRPSHQHIHSIKDEILRQLDSNSEALRAIANSSERLVRESDALKTTLQEQAPVRAEFNAAINYWMSKWRAQQNPIPMEIEEDKVCVAEMYRFGDKITKEAIQEVHESLSTSSISGKLVTGDIKSGPHDYEENQDEKDDDEYEELQLQLIVSNSEDRFAVNWREEEENEVDGSQWKAPRGKSANEAFFSHVLKKCQDDGYTGNISLVEGSSEYRKLRQYIRGGKLNTFWHNGEKYRVEYKNNSLVLICDGKKYDYAHHKCLHENCWSYAARKNMAGRCVDHLKPDEVAGRVLLYKDDTNQDKHAYYLRFMSVPKKDAKSFMRSELKRSECEIRKYLDKHPEADFSTPAIDEPVSNAKRNVMMSTIAIGMEILTLFQHSSNKSIHMLATQFEYNHTDLNLLKQFLLDNGITFEIGEGSKTGKLTTSPLVENFTKGFPFEYITFGQPGATYHGVTKSARRDDFRSEVHRRNSKRNDGKDTMYRGLQGGESKSVSAPLWQEFDLNIENFPDLSPSEKKDVKFSLEQLKKKRQGWYRNFTTEQKTMVINKMLDKAKRQESVTTLVKVVAQMLDAKLDCHKFGNRNIQYSMGLSKLSEYEKQAFGIKFEYFCGRKIRVVSTEKPITFKAFLEYAKRGRGNGGRSIHDYFQPAT